MSAPKVAAALAAVALTLSAAAYAQADAHRPHPAARPAPHDGMTPGRPFQDPPDANTGTDLKITLTAAGTLFDLSGRKAWGQSYNGSYVAPTIHLKPGGTAAITLVNRLPVATNLHFHGLHVSPSDDSDNSFLCIAPHHTMHYHLAVPANHPLGTFWYHSHAMGAACPSDSSAKPMPDMPDMPGMKGGGGTMGMAGTSSDSPGPSESPGSFERGEVENQIFAGLSGALIVGDDRTLLPPSLRNVTAHTFVFKDVQIDQKDHILQNTDTTSIDSDQPTTRLVNGQLQPELTMRPGTTQLWRLVNAGADIFYQLQLDGYHFCVIGEDGRPVARVTTPDKLLLPPAKRYDVLVTAGPRAGHTWLRTTAYSNGPEGDSYPDVPLVGINIAGPARSATASAASFPALRAGTALATAQPELSRLPIARRRVLRLSQDEEDTNFFINGRQFSMDHSVFDAPAKLGTTEEWVILNESGEIHPFHLHTDAFQVISINGKRQRNPNYQDIVPVPNGVNGVPGRVVIRIRFTDFTGPWMFHCHIAAHEDGGMMSYVNVIR